MALIERHLMGGDCLNTGCVPSKALLSAARAAASVSRAASYGVRTGGAVHVDFSAVMERMRRLRASIAPHDSVARFRELGVDVFAGTGRFAGRDRIVVTDPESGGKEYVLSFARAVICTGGRPAVPPIPGLKDVAFLTSDTVFSLTDLPPRLGIIGAGPIGCELAQCFARFGSQVILVESSHGVLPREDPDAADVVRKALIGDGVRLLCCGQNMAVRSDSGKIRLTLESHGTSCDEQVDALLVATGRAPVTEGLDLETAGIAYDETGVTVDERLRTTNPSVYAAGDICSSQRFTHAADFQARIVLRNALFRGRMRADALRIPRVVYTEPELAQVGHTHQDAADAGISIDTYTLEFADVDRSVLDGQDEGFVRIHTARGRDRIVGATIVGTAAGDLLSEITLAMNHGIGLRRIADTIHPYPTRAEAIRRIGDLYNRTRLTPRVRSLMKRWLAWTV